ncbi:MAG TPA: FkbM family methyltransferase [Terriglobia bacterium]|nr:FkbM family methyltransferase [Terriglobia bacterium]
MAANHPEIQVRSNVIRSVTLGVGSIAQDGKPTMQVTEAIRRITYSSWPGSSVVRKCIYRFGLGRSAQWLYTLARCHGKTVKLELNGVEGWFSAQTPAELRNVEGYVLFYEHEMLSAIQEILKPGDVFLDVGSNRGIFTIFAAKAVGPHGMVVACEPATSAFNLLQRNTEINHLNNVKLMKLALSDARSVRNLVIDDPTGLGLTSHLSDADGHSEKVRTADYDSLVAEAGLPVPRVVKMDIEGHEYAALKGMGKTLSSSACVALFCEIHPYALTPGIFARDVEALIESFGFTSVSMKTRREERQVTAMKHATGTVIRQ